MQKDKNFSKKHDNKYKRTGQTFQKVYNILKMDVELDIANTNFNNKNNQSDKKIKQLIKTPELSLFDNSFQRSFN